jgi:PAS domain S-box-containing protein
MAAGTRLFGQRLAGYGLAVIAGGAALLLRLALVHIVGELPHYITFYPAVMLAAVLGGFGPGLLATVVTALLADYWAIPPQGFGGYSMADAAGLGLYLGMGLLMSGVAERYRRAQRRAAEEQGRRRAKEDWEQTFDSVPDLLALLDDQHRIVRVNRAMAQRLELTPDQCIGRKCHEAVHGAAAPPDFCPHTLTCRDGKEHVAEVHEPRLGGDFLVSTSPRFDAQGRLSGAIHVARDITERKKEERALARQNRTLKALGDSGQAMMRATDEATYLRDVCRIVVEDCGHAMVWVGYAEHDEAKTVRPAAWSGFEEGYLETLQITWADTERGRGPTGTAIRTGCASMCRNVLTDPQFAPWRAEALKRGYASSLALPLRAADQVFGALMIYSRAPDPFTDAEIRLLTELADDLAYGVMALRLRKAHVEAEEQLRREKVFADALIDVLPGVFYLFDAQGRLARWNKNFETVTGYSGPELGGMAPWDFFRGNDRDLIRQWAQRVFEAGEATVEAEFVAKDGRAAPYFFTGVRVDFGSGPCLVGMGLDVTERRRAEEGLRESNARLKLLSEVSARLLETEDPQALVEELCQSVMVHLGCDGFFNFLADQASGRLHLNACAGISAHEARQIEWLDYGVAVCGCAAQSGQRIIAEDIQHTDDPRTTLVKSYGMQAYACHPLLAQGRVIGTLSFGTRTRPRFRPDELELMKTVADQVAVAMERIRTQQSLRELNDTLERRVVDRTALVTLVHDIASAANRATTFHEAVQFALQRMCEHHGWSLGQLLEPSVDDPDRLVLSDASYAREPGRFERFQALSGRHLPRRGEGVIGRVLATRQPEWTTEAARHMIPARAEAARAAGLQTLLALPVLAGQELVGILEFYSEHTIPPDERALAALVSVGLQLGQVVERERAAEGLRAASAYNRSLIEASLDPLVTIAADGKITDVNAATEKATGCSRAELIGTDFSDYFTAPEKARAGYEQVFREGVVQDYALEIRHRDGHRTPVLYNAAIYRDAAGQVLGVFAAARDITAARRAEEALRQASAYNRSLIEASLDPLVTIAADGKITDVNAATEKVTGYARHKLIGTDFSNYFTAPEKARAGYEQVFREGLVRDYPLEVRQVNGHHTPVLYNASVYRDADGKVRGVFAAARDITERKQAEEAVKRERQRLNDVLEMLPVYVVLLTPDYHVPFANRFFRERFGESHGQRCFEYLFQRQEPCDVCETYKVLKTNRPLEWEWAGPDGRDYHIFDFPVTDTDGSPLIMEVGVDITARKQAELELRRLNEELEQRVAARTAELQASNKELEAFAYSVSHDLRAPLRAMDGFSQALLEDYSDKLDLDGRNHLQRVRAASQRMADLIDGMLTLSRTTRIEMRRSVVDLSRLAQAITLELRKSAPQRQVEFVMAPGLVVNGDPNLLRSLLANLLDNAWKFTSKHATARIELGALQRGGETVYFVRDDGAGFDMTYVDNLFGVFRRLHSTVEYEGTGVGLATVQRIVNRHGGRVWAEGKPEQGATFYFTLSPEPRQL